MNRGGSISGGGGDGKSDGIAVLEYRLAVPFPIQSQSCSTSWDLLEQ